MWERFKEYIKGKNAFSGAYYNPEYVAYVIYNIDDNELHAFGWINQYIRVFSGEYTLEKFKAMKDWCKYETYLYMYSINKNIIYRKPIMPYFKNETLIIHEIEMADDRFRQL